MEKEVFLVDELENRLIIEGVNYQHRLSANWQTEKFDPEYFENFITGPLFTEFVTALFERIRPLNAQEINRYLTLSVAQFTTHTPEKREKEFILNYWHTYWYPNTVEPIITEYEQKFARHILKHYAKHFHLFKDATEKALTDFKAGLLGTPPPPQTTPALQVQHDKLKTNLSVPQLALLFKMLNELKPSIFDIKTETELHRFISANFETKKSTEDGISPKKLKNLFNSPDSKAADFWQKHLHTLLDFVKKIK